MDTKYMKFENPLRLEELKPYDTLKKIGLTENGILCDIGAGSGVFTIPAAMITRNTVYAIEISEEMLQVLQDKINAQSIQNIELIKSENDHLPIDKNSVDIVLMVTVLHEIREKSVILEEIRNILKTDGGKFAVIEFHKRETPMGPPIPHRIGKDEVINMMIEKGFRILENYDLGENFYCLVFTHNVK